MQPQPVDSNCRARGHVVPASVFTNAVSDWSPPSPSHRLPMSQLPLAGTPSRRRCNACTVCCVALPMPEGYLEMGGKAAGVPCTHMTEGGCRKYEARPKPCRDFLCAWLADVAWPAAWRPDRSGLLCLREELATGLVGAAVYETIPGALGWPATPEILQTLVETTAILVVIDVKQQRRTISRLADISVEALRRVAA